MHFDVEVDFIVKTLFLLGCLSKPEMTKRSHFVFFVLGGFPPKKKT